MNPDRPAERPTTGRGLSVSGIAAVARHESRRKAAGQLVLAVFAGVALAVAVGGLSTARRTATAYDRLVEASGTADYRAAIIGGADVSDDVVAAPGVRAWWAATAAVARLDGFGVVYVSVETGPHDEHGVVRPVVARGRPVDPGAHDEVLVAQRVADELGIEPGDELSLSFLTPGEMLQFDTGFGDPDGPRITVRVVGVTRAAGVHARTAVVAGPAFASRYAEAISVGTALYMDVEPGTVPRGRFVEAVEDIAGAQHGAADGPVEFLPIELVGPDDDRAAYAATARVLDVGQVVAAGIILAGASLTVVQVVARRQRLDRADQLIEAALGFSAAERTVARALAAVPAALVAAIVASTGVALAGTLEPLGALAALEPHPGWAPHGGLVAAAGAGAAALIVVSTAWAAWQTGRTRATDRRLVTSPRRSVLRAVGSPAAAVGIGLALDSSRGGQQGSGGVPVRASMTAVTAGVAGLAAVLTFGASLDRLVAEPERWGFTADISVIDANDDIVADLTADPAVGDLSLLSVNQLRVDGRVVDAYAIDDVGAPGPGWTVLDGRLPHDDAEVVLGRRVAGELGARTGSTIDLADGTRLSVVGTGVGPVLNGEGLGMSMLVTSRRLAESGETTGFREALVVAADREGAAGLIADLSERYEVMVRRPPDEVANLDQLGRLPDILASSLAVIAGAALVHALIAVAGRRSTFAVLRALGFTTRDVAATLLSTGLTIVGVAVAIGIPLGIAAGRLVWWAVADAVAVATGAAVPVGPIGAAAVGALLVAAGSAVVPVLRPRRSPPVRIGRDGAAPP